VNTLVHARRPALSQGGAAAVLALLMALQPATTDIYLPALPLLTQALAAPMVLAQMTMAALILAFGFGQLLWGPVADRVGRRPVLLGTLLLYALASAGGALAGSIEQLVLWRALQGFTMAGAVVCSRAMVRDLYEPVEGAQVMALALSGLGLVAIAGPALGGFVASGRGLARRAGGGGRLRHADAGGRGLAPAGNPGREEPARHRGRGRCWPTGPMLRHPGFRAWMLLLTCTYGGIFTTWRRRPSSSSTCSASTAAVRAGDGFGQRLLHGRHLRLPALDPPLRPGGHGAACGRLHRSPAAR
jgi:DHA1 family bicyclomycin/chloramphenicol resistance-like MFS transporter